MKESRVGLDIGRVLIAPVDGAGEQDTSFLVGSEEAAMETPPSEGAFEVVRELVDCFEGRVWLVSKCGSNVERRTRAWLHHQDFFVKTGFSEGQLRFCKRRPEKALHCRELAITHFVDDRLDVLRHLEGLVPHLYLFGYQPARQPCPPWALPVLDWSEVRRALFAK